MWCDSSGWSRACAPRPRQKRSPQPKVAPEAADNPTYIQLRTQREAMTTQRQGLEEKRVTMKARIKELEGRLEASPGVEQEYAALRRDLDNTQMKYREVRQKQMEAQLAQSLESERKGERFSLIEPPLVPEEPTSPNRRMIIVLGLIMALVIAAGTAITLEVLDGRIRGAAHLSLLVTAPPLVVIPQFDRPEARRRRKILRIATAAGTVVAAALALALIDPVLPSTRCAVGDRHAQVRRVGEAAWTASPVRSNSPAPRRPGLQRHRSPRAPRPRACSARRMSGAPRSKASTRRQLTWR